MVCQPHRTLCSYYADNGEGCEEAWGGNTPLRGPCPGSAQPCLCTANCLQGHPRMKLSFDLISQLPLRDHQEKLLSGLTSLFLPITTGGPASATWSLIPRALNVPSYHRAFHPPIPQSPAVCPLEPVRCHQQSPCISNFTLESYLITLNSRDEEAF